MRQGSNAGNLTIEAPMRWPRATIRTVAEYAGVSTATVSRTLNGSGNVSPELRSAVTRAAKELGYSGNAVAAALRSSQSNTVGMIVPDITNSPMCQVIGEVEKILQELGIQLLLTSSQWDASKEDRAVTSLTARRVDGLIIAPVAGVSRLPCAKKGAQAPPIIQIDPNARGLVIDDSAAAANSVLLLVVERLQSLATYHPSPGRRNAASNFWKAAYPFENEHESAPGTLR